MRNWIRKHGRKKIPVVWLLLKSAAIKTLLQLYSFTEYILLKETQKALFFNLLMCMSMSMWQAHALQLQKHIMMTIKWRTSTFCTILTLLPKALAYGQLQREWCFVACACISFFQVFPLLYLASNSHVLSFEAVSECGMNQISKTVLWTLKGVWVPQTLGLGSLRTEFQDTEFQDSPLTRINQTL